MRMSQGVEWALHCCLNLAWAGEPVPAARLAELNDLPPAYLGKQLQHLARAGLVVSVSGPRGGFRLARPAEEISVLEVVDAIEGATPAFQCTEIRRRGPLAASPKACRTACQIAQVMDRADAAWRRELAAVSVADIAAEVGEQLPAVPVAIGGWLRQPRA